MGNKDMTAREFFTGKGGALTLDFLNEEEQEFLLRMIELYASGKVKQASSQADVVFSEPLFRWVKADKDNLPTKEDKMQVHILYKGVPDLLICINRKWYWFQENIESSMEYPVDKDSWSAIEWLEQLPSPVYSGWVSVHDGLPGIEQDVLMFYTIPHKDGHYKYFEIGCIQSIENGKDYKNVNWINKDYHVMNPTHWQPLPSPPPSQLPNVQG